MIFCYNVIEMIYITKSENKRRDSFGANVNLFLVLFFSSDELFSFLKGKKLLRPRHKVIVWSVNCVLLLKKDFIIISVMVGIGVLYILSSRIV